MLTRYGKGRTNGLDLKVTEGMGNMKSSFKEVIIVLPEGLRHLILSTASACPDETGGALVGYRLQRDDEKELWFVRTFIPPGPKALHGPSTFAQGGLFQAALLSLIRRLERWPQSSPWKGKGPMYLGDWHSHPNFSNKPSSGDKATVSRLLNEEEELGSLVVMVAGSGEGKKWSIGTHLASRHGKEICWQEKRVSTPEELSLNSDLQKIDPWPSPQRLLRMLRRFKERRGHGKVN